MAKLGVGYTQIFKDKKTNIITGSELVKNELNLLLQMSHGELFGGNGMGLNIESFLYLKNKTATFNLIRAEVEKVFNNYSKASLTKLTIEYDNEISAVILGIDCVTQSGEALNITMPMEVN